MGIQISSAEFIILELANRGDDSIAENSYRSCSLTEISQLVSKQLNNSQLNNRFNFNPNLFAVNTKTARFSSC